MKKTILLSITLILTSCYQQEKNCTDFKTGKFSFVQEINGQKHTTIFIRTENLQIETYQGKTDTASVRWINDCEFVIQKLHPKNMAEEKAIHMKILTTEKDGYTFEYNLVGNTNKQRGIVKKIN